ncbi:MAG: hypothetical protein ACHQ0J_15020 [Candidatus Dormibacterales bacterium]
MMRSARSVLALRYTPVSIAGGVRKAVGGFLRYVQFRDQHVEPERNGALDAYVRYVAHRDRTSPAGRVFGNDGERREGDRRRLVDFVARSTKGLEPKWVLGRDRKLADRQRAVYTFVLSPEDWRGLDLRRIARAAMDQLGTDAGSGGIGPWFAAEHRNTAHHHVHIVLAARREVAPGRFSTLVVSRARLQRMKDAIALEIDRQRSPQRMHTNSTQLPQRATRIATPQRRCHAAPRWRWLPVQAPKARWRSRQAAYRSNLDVTLSGLRSLARSYQRRMEHELEEDLARRELEGWAR